MSRHPDHPVERLLAALPGWLLLTGALALLGLTLITPSWLEGREMAWQRDYMRAQLESLARQQERYVQFYAALEANDPVLLERLAFTHLRLTAADKQMLDPADVPRLTRTSTNAAAHAEADRRAVSSSDPAAVDAWLAEPLPVVGVDVPAPHVPETRLTRLTRGRSRVGLIVAAMACFLGALWYGEGKGAEGPGGQGAE